MMLIVAGAFELDPADRDAFLAGRSEAMLETRKEPGNLEYVMSADPVDPTRVILLERWADQDAFDAHMKVIASAPRGSGPAPKGMSIKIYDVSGERSLG
jgi:quinol monooxygenase YgiN